ncbi:peptidoglycan-binding protein [Cryptosporangium sp. NPDC051539]|uniref:peptidoglycan-binding protein n=1 Tax=Cryptosporangium sp. NPDC051539 TaxID=3363962 RepID=UPI00379C5DDA
MRALLSTAAVAIIAAAGLAATASPAAAATPQCTRSGTEYGAYGYLIIPVSSGGSSSCWLAQGSVSSAVTALQQVLNCNGKAGTPLSVDGDFGPATKNAVIGYQRWINSVGGNLAVDGVYGPNTEDAIGRLPRVSDGACVPRGG